MNVQENKVIPWINKARAALKEAFGLSIAMGLLFDSPGFGTHVPIGNEDIGC